MFDSGMSEDSGQMSWLHGKHLQKLLFAVLDFKIRWGQKTFSKQTW